MPQESGLNQRNLWLAAWIYFCAVMVAYGCVILIAKAPPSFVDYPDWVYQGFLFHGALIGHPFAGYVLKHYPVPNSTTTVGLGLLDLVFPWQLAAKLWICFYLALAGFSSWTLARASGVQDWRLVVALPGIIFLNLTFWLGQVSIELGLCLLMLLLAMLLNEMAGTWIAGMLVLLFFTHMEACAAGLLLFTLWCGYKRRWILLWAAAPAVSLTAWYALVRIMNRAGDGGTLHPDFSYGSFSFIIYKVNTYFKTLGYVNACAPNRLSQTEAIFGRDLYLLMIAAAFIIAILCISKVIRVARLRIRDESLRFIGVFVLILLALSLVLPQVMLGTADPGSRLLLMSVALGLFGVKWRTRTGTALAWLSVCFALRNLWQFAKIDSNPYRPGHRKDLPAAVLRFSHTEPQTLLPQYEDIDKSEMTSPIYPTGIFVYHTQ
jgi:hypothetical protein